MERRLFALQRLSGMALGPFVIVHLGVVLYALRGGLTAAEILGRTRGSLGWGLFYGIFVVAATVHAPIGLRNVMIEWTRLPAGVVDWSTLLFGALLLVLGLAAVWATVG
jgi:fumarate reductase subunit C